MTFHCFFPSEPTAPQFLMQPRGTSNVTAGSNVSIICEASGAPEAQITWYKKNVNAGTIRINLVGRQSPLTIRHVTANDQGIYWCVATNILGNATSTSLFIQGQ